MARQAPGRAHPPRGQNRRQTEGGSEICWLSAGSNQAQVAGRLCALTRDRQPACCKLGSRGSESATYDHVHQRLHQRLVGQVGLLLGDAVDKVHQLEERHPLDLLALEVALGVVEVENDGANVKLGEEELLAVLRRRVLQQGQGLELRHFALASNRGSPAGGTRRTSRRHCAERGIGERATTHGLPRADQSVMRQVARAAPRGCQAVVHRTARDVCPCHLAAADPESDPGPVLSAQQWSQGAVRDRPQAHRGAARLGGGASRWLNGPAPPHPETATQGKRDRAHPALRDPGRPGWAGGNTATAPRRAGR